MKNNCLFLLTLFFLCLLLFLLFSPTVFSESCISHVIISDFDKTKTFLTDSDADGFSDDSDDSDGSSGADDSPGISRNYADLMNSGICENGVCPVPRQNPSLRPNPAVVRIIVTHENTKSYGTGTLVYDDANHYFILTCAHLFEKDRPRKITVVFPDQSLYDVRMLAIDRVWDLAILQNEVWRMECGVWNELTPYSTLHTPLFTLSKNAGIPLGKSAPRVGDVLYYAGYGSTGQYLLKKGRLEGYCAVRNDTAAETLVITGSARQGDSGGPIVNAQGELVGVLWGTDGRTVCGTYNGRIYQFIRTAQSENRFLAPSRGNESGGAGAGNQTPGAAFPQTVPAAVPASEMPGNPPGKMSLDEILYQLTTYYPELLAQFMKGNSPPAVSDENHSAGKGIAAIPDISGLGDEMLEKLEGKLKTRLDDFVKENSRGLLSGLLSTVLSALCYTLPPIVAVIYMTRKIVQKVKGERVNG